MVHRLASPTAKAMAHPTISSQVTECQVALPMETSMRRLTQRAHRAVMKLALLVTAGVMFQTTGCVDTTKLASDLTSVFVSTLISDYVYDQAGVANSLFF